MCGIVGFFGSGDAEVLKHLTSLLSHRGPDGDGIHVDTKLGIFVGHRRLAIRDIAGGLQPMSSLDGRYLLSFNGEIFNDGGLREELEASGVVFQTSSDTEVVLQSLIAWGEEAIPKLDGQFAFCFVDKEERYALLARDRFGEKPLYWCNSKQGLVFASESSVVASHPWIEPQLDESNCQLFLLLGYLPPPLSIIRDVFQLRPGSCLRYAFGQSSSITHETFATPFARSRDDHERGGSARLTINEISAAVASRRVSDVEVGVLLSGGIDSSLIVSAAVRESWKPRVYTVGFAPKSFDESEAARQLAIELNLKHHLSKVRIPSSSELVRVLRTLDEPLGDSSYFPTFEAFRLASEHSKVVLTGDGADELFFGYEPFRALKVAQLVRRLLNPRVTYFLSRILRSLPRKSSYMNAIDVAERFLDGARFPVRTRILVWMCTLRTYEWENFFYSPPEPLAVLAPELEESQASTDLEIARSVFLTWYLPGSIFRKSDTASMANSVEARTVFLHPEITSFASQQPGRSEVSFRLGKKSLRRIAHEIGLVSISRRKKHGFAMPLADALKGLEGSAPRPRLRYLNQLEVDREWEKLRQGRSKNSQFLWALVTLVNCRAYRVAVGTEVNERTANGLADSVAQSL